MATKAWKRINIFQSLRFKLDRETLEIIYFSFIRPYLEYADVVWDNCTNTEKHEAAFIVTGATRSCPKSKLLEETGWESLDHRRYKHRLTTFHKMIYKETPSYLHSLVPQSVHQVSQRNLRSRSNIQTPLCRPNLYQNSFLNKTVKNWNALSENTRNIRSIAEFKRFLDKDKKKVPIYFYSGERICQILHARLRLGCSSLNADLYKNHLREDNRCSCGYPETAAHFFYECYTYTILRNRTIATIPLPTNVDILLSGCPLYEYDVNEEIFAQVHNFIIHSNIFS